MHDYLINIAVFLSGPTKEALKSDLSDMEYLRSKVAQTDDTMEESEEKRDDDDENEDCGPTQNTDSAYESGDRDNTSKAKTSVSSEDKRQSKTKKSTKEEVILYIQKLNTTVRYSTGCFFWFTPTLVCCRWSQRHNLQ